MASSYGPISVLQVLENVYEKIMAIHLLEMLLEVLLYGAFKCEALIFRLHVIFAIDSHHFRI